MEVLSEKHHLCSLTDCLVLNVAKIPCLFNPSNLKRAFSFLLVKLSNSTSSLIIVWDVPCDEATQLDNTVNRKFSCTP
jgi:hypothetical protein